MRRGTRATPIVRAFDPFCRTLVACSPVDEPLEPAPRDAVTRRRLLQGALGAAVLAAGGAAGAGAAAYADTAARRDRASCARDGARTATSTRVLWRAQTDEPVLALTFDDGPHPAYTPALLDVLAEERVRATFFVVGERAHGRREMVRRQLGDRHELGNHSWTHADLSGLDLPQARDEVGRTSQLLTDLAGRPPAVLRPPYGRLTGSVLQVAAEQDMDVLAWDARLRERELDVAGNVAHVLDALRPGMVLLAHDAGPRHRQVGMAAVPDIVRRARERGFRFVTASEMLQLDRRAAPQSDRV